MRFHNVSEDLFGNQTTVRVLRTLIQRPSRSFTGRELAIESGTPPTRTIEALQRLEDQGVVSSRPAGRATLWTVTLTHALYEGVRAWFDFERGLEEAVLTQIRDAVASCPSIQRAVLFGSVARGDERPSSDIDLLIIVDREANKAEASAALATLADDLRATFTNPLRPLIYAEREWESKRKLGLARSINREGIVLMERPPVKAERLDRHKGDVYLRKAEEFARGMDRAAIDEDWNAVGLLAVHVVISAADALTTAHLGLRSRGADHEEVVHLLRRLPSKGAVDQAARAVEVLQVKNQVEYEARPFEQKEAVATRKKASRFLEWARTQMRP